MRIFFIVVAFCCAQAANAQPAISVTRELRIDGVDNVLVRPSFLIVGRDGLIAFSQPQDLAIRFHDATGRLLGKFGRGGQGPGEFQILAGAGWVGTAEELRRHTGALSTTSALRQTRAPGALTRLQAYRAERAICAAVSNARSTSDSRL